VKVRVIDPHREPAIQRLERLARLLDSSIHVPGTKLTVGVDPILGLIPGVGDALALVASVYIVAMGSRLGVPRRTVWRMGMNVAVDAVVGSIPVLGDLFDAGFKANTKNVALIRRAVLERR
jgi:hypothetical protein